jgi:hypothetical protein
MAFTTPQITNTSSKQNKKGIMESASPERLEKRKNTT